MGASVAVGGVVAVTTVAGSERTVQDEIHTAVVRPRSTANLEKSSSTPARRYWTCCASGRVCPAPRRPATTVRAVLHGAGRRSADQLLPDSGGHARGCPDHHHRGLAVRAADSILCNKRSSMRTPSSAATAPPAKSCPASVVSPKGTRFARGNTRVDERQHLSLRCLPNIVKAVATVARDR
ncbi:putative carbon monoxide dehydrogenase small chain CoxS [Mycobacterium kansasii]|uniref:Putative carbon monoxide dehydrogenase small chain CoxS n=1 Tax=Mycobacterium kansasii TaxID=1768 RepID=A0A1V3WJJ0_MYCKA|nr:putative carbon monoxide dehydrogenase small chain CoxS [Mycobacterium kansasii]